MALKDILKSKKSDAKKVGAPKEKHAAPVVGSSRVSHTVIKHPRITEKAALLSEKNVYAFEVDAHTNKIEVKNAIKEIYGVTPISINMVNIPAKKTIVRGKRGMKSAIRKAYVTLKKGETIEFAA